MSANGDLQADYLWVPTGSAAVSAYPSDALWAFGGLIVNVPVEQNLVATHKVAEFLTSVVNDGASPLSMTVRCFPDARISLVPGGLLVEPATRESFVSPEYGAEPAAPLVARAPSPEAPQARLARDLRERTGLPAATLAAALGVSREQFQRWIAGRPISAIRHGLLIHLSTLANDVTRRLGRDEALVWWRTPSSLGATPEELLASRLVDGLQRLISELPDPAPVRDGRIVAVDIPIQHEDSDIETADEDWSPFMNGSE